MSALISCENLTLGYEGQAVISGLSFAVNAGDYLCIVGDNGSGKTTLMRAILGLLSPMSGQITMGGGARQTEIGYMPQQTVVQRDFPATVGEVVLSGCLNRCGLRPFYNIDEKLDAEMNMEKLGIIGLRRRCYRELSGGQQQRTLLARALCATQKIILLDEPAAGLDPMASEEMYEQIAMLNRESLTVIMISHDISAAMKYSTHILKIGNGQDIFFGTAKDFEKDSSLRNLRGRESE